MKELISKTEVFNILKRDAADGNCMTLIADSTIKEIEQLQTIDAQPVKHGMWLTKTVKRFCASDCWYPGVFAIEDSWNEEEGSWLEEQNGFCSECEKQDDHYSIHKYCPNCGAKMNG